MNRSKAIRNMLIKLKNYWLILGILLINFTQKRINNHLNRHNKMTLYK